VSEQSTEGKQLVVSYLFLRRAVGWIAILLPIVLLVGNLISSAASPPESMSGYYYTDMRNIFVGSLCALGVFLVAYNGYDNVDRWVTSIAGLGAIGVAFCPTKPAVCVTGAVTCPPPSVRQLATHQTVVGDIHLGFALVAFLMLGLMALRFAKTGPTPAGLGWVGQLRYGLGFGAPAAGAPAAGAPAAGPPGAGQPAVGAPRDSAADTVIYRVSGITVFACVLLAILANLLPASVNASWRLLFIFEAVAVVAFGVSWFAKGHTIAGIQALMQRGATAAKTTAAARALEDHR
jgi:hypothetical protein